MAEFQRETAVRVFAHELRESHHTVKEGDDQYTPTYLITPTGARCNRVFAVGVLTEKDDIGQDTEYWRARVTDPTGAFIIYAGQYQQEAARSLVDAEVPSIVAVVGKPNVYETPDGTTMTSIRAESVSVVDDITRDLWVLEAVRHTFKRMEDLDGDSEDAKIAREIYEFDRGAYREVLMKAAKSLRSLELQVEDVA